MCLKKCNNSTTDYLSSIIDRHNELKSLVKEIEESEKYFKWYTTESWSREMTEEEERKGDDLYDLNKQCQSRIFEIIKSL